MYSRASSSIIHIHLRSAMFSASASAKQPLQLASSWPLLPL